LQLDYWYCEQNPDAAVSWLVVYLVRIHIPTYPPLPLPFTPPFLFSCCFLLFCLDAASAAVFTPAPLSLVLAEASADAVLTADPPLLLLAAAAAVAVFTLVPRNDCRESVESRLKCQLSMVMLLLELSSRGTQVSSLRYYCIQLVEPLIRC